MKKTFKKLCLFAFLIGSTTIIGCKNDDLIIRKTDTTNYAVTFNTNGGSAIETQVVESDKTLIKPTDPTKASFVFEGWFKDVALTTAFDFATEKVTTNATLYAKWKTDVITVTFSDPLLNSTMPANIATNELKSTDVANPTKAGYTFVGWSETSAVYGAIISFPYTVKSNTTLYPQWVSTIDVSNTTTNSGKVTINLVNQLSTEIVIIPVIFNGMPVELIGGVASGSPNLIIKTVHLPQGLKAIGNNAFNNCTAVTNINIPSSVIFLDGGAFYNCTALTSIAIPNTVTNIKMGTFYKCAALTSIVIPSSVTNIDMGAFSECTALTSVTIPSSVIGIWDNAFNGCSKLALVTIGRGSAHGALTTLRPAVFSGTAPGLQIKVPSADVAAYQAAAYWSDHAGKIVSQ